MMPDLTIILPLTPGNSTGKMLSYDVPENIMDVSAHIKILIIGDIINRDYFLNCIRTLRQHENCRHYVFWKNNLSRIAGNLNGTCSLLLLDVLRNRVYLISDKSGYVPVYYFKNGGYFIISTSIRLMLDTGIVKREVNKNALYELLKLGFVIPPDTLIGQIKRLLPGDCLEFQTTIRIDTPPGKPRTTRSCPVDVAAEEYFTKLEAAVLESVKGYDKVTLSLSGGIDSAAIAALLHRNKIAFDCCTLDFIPEHSTELSRARWVASAFHAGHYVYDRYDNCIFQHLGKVVMLNEMPVYNGLVDYILGQKILGNSPLILTGDGNDLIWNVFPPGLNNRIAKDNFARSYLTFRSRMPDELVNKVRLFDTEPFRVQAKINALYDNRKDFFTNTCDIDGKLFGACYSLSSLGKLRQTGSGVKYRFPYLNNELRQFIQRIPNTYKQKVSGKDVLYKYLFRYVVDRQRLLPESLIYARKSWLGSPNAEWLRAQLLPVVKNIITSTDSATGSYFDVSQLKKLLYFHCHCNHDLSQLLMFVLQFEIWHKQFIENQEFNLIIS